jgi:NTE family protein
MSEPIIKEGKRRPKIGLVIGSGGVKTMGGIEILSLLAERQIPIDLIVGCSGGAVIGACAAKGYTIDQMRHFATSLYTPALFSVNFKSVAAMLKVPFMHFDESMGIFNGSPLEQACDRLYQGMLIEEAKIPLRIQATDLETGEGVILSSGDCGRAVQASSAMIPFLPPCLVEGRWLIDGAYSQALPIMEAVRANMDVIIAVSFDEIPIEKPTNFMALTSFLIGKTQRNTISTQSGRALSFHHHEIIFVPLIFDRMINLWEASTIPMIYDVGRKAAQSAIRDIEKAIEDFYCLYPE